VRDGYAWGSGNRREQSPGVPKRPRRFQGKPRLSSAESTARADFRGHHQPEGAIAAATAGLAIVATAGGACRSELEDGSLLRLLHDWSLGAVDLHAVFLAGRAAKQAARAFVDYLAAEYVSA
jgi:DNA-binding transcriptional LysR family regulator